VDATVKYFKTTVLAAVVALATATAAKAADPLSIDFNSYALGDLPGNNTPTDNRTAGDDNTWWVPSNAATSAEVRAGIGLGGSNALVIGNRGNGNDGVIDNVKSPRLEESAGETGTNSGLPAGTIASGTQFVSSFHFRTASDAPVDGFSFKTENYGPDRASYLGFFYQTANGDTSLNAGAYDIEADGSFTFHPLAANLVWGEWYRVESTMTFVDGADNDLVDHKLYNSANSLVGSVSGIGSWEEGARVNGYNGGTVFGVDAVQFQARGASLNGAGVPHDVAFVDNMSFSVIPEPATMVLGGLASLGMLVARRRMSRA
jgi:hypothetical protein